jgi:hypothetical protein
VCVGARVTRGQGDEERYNVHVAARHGLRVCPSRAALEDGEGGLGFDSYSARVLDQTAGAPTQEPEAGPPVRGMVLVAMAVVEGVENG